MKEMVITSFDYIRKQKTMLVIVSGFWLLQWYFWHSLYRIFLLQDGLYGTTYGIIGTLGPAPRIILGIPFLLASVFVLLGSKVKNAKYLSVAVIICLVLEIGLILVVVLSIFSPIDRTTFSLS
jgi:hypothetical protein